MAYNQAGNLVVTENSSASYDSAGRKTYSFTTQTDEFPTGARMFNATINQTLDGGWMRGRTEYRYVEQTINEEFDYTEDTVTQHFLWSSVLGAIVAELDENDELSTAFVFAGQRIAALEITPSTSAVYFRTRNPQTGTTYRTDHTGKGGRHEEFDPLGAQVPKVDPYILNHRLYTDIKPPGKLFMSDASPYAYDNSCSVDGIPTQCHIARRLAESGAADQLVQADVYIRYASGREEQYTDKVSSALAGINQVWTGKAAQVAADGFYSALRGGLEAAIDAAFRNVYIWQNDRLPENNRGARNYAHASPQKSSRIESVSVPLLNFKKLLEDTLAFSDCADFMSRVIAKAGELSKGKNDPVSTDIMTLYAKVNQQARGGFRLNHQGPHDVYSFRGYERLENVAGGAGAAWGAWGLSNITVWIDQQSIPVNTTAKNIARVPFKYAETALHELFHIAGENGYYGHAIMDASAAFFEPGLSFDQAVKKHCIPVENQ